MFVRRRCGNSPPSLVARASVGFLTPRRPQATTCSLRGQVRLFQIVPRTVCDAGCHANHPGQSSHHCWGPVRASSSGRSAFRHGYGITPKHRIDGTYEHAAIRRRDPGRRVPGEAIGYPDPGDVQAHGLLGSPKKSYIISNKEG